MYRKFPRGKASRWYVLAYAGDAVYMWLVLVMVGEQNRDYDGTTLHAYTELCLIIECYKMAGCHDLK